MIRIFVAVDLDSPSRREIDKLLEKLSKKHWQVRWEKPEKLHITLVFLGWQEEINLDKAKTILKKIKFFPIVLSFKGLGCFPDYQWPRIIWLGLAGDLKSLVLLRDQIKKEFKGAGFNIDSRPFVPHITLARVKNGVAQAHRLEIGRQLKALQKIKFSSKWLVDKVILYQSKLSNKGSIYRQLFQQPLK